MLVLLPWLALLLSLVLNDSDDEPPCIDIDELTEWDVLMPWV